MTRLTRCDAHSEYQRGCRGCQVVQAAYQRYRYRMQCYGRPYKQRILVSNVGTVRRLHALGCQGFIPSRVLEQVIGVRRQASFQRLVSKRRISQRTHDAVKRFFEEHRTDTGPSNWIRSYAAREGWAPRHVWTDIDDPKERPKGRVYLATSVARDAKVIRRLAAKGMSDREISNHLDGRLSKTAVQQIRKRHGIPSWKG